MGGEGVRKAGEGHRLTLLQRIEERLELRLVWMVTDVAAIEHLHRELRPGALVEPAEFLAVKLIVQDRSLAPHEVRVEVVWLKAIDNGRAFPHGSAGEAEQRR